MLAAEIKSSNFKEKPVFLDVMDILELQVYLEKGDWMDYPEHLDTQEGMASLDYPACQGKEDLLVSMGKTEGNGLDQNMGTIL